MNAGAPTFDIGSDPETSTARKANHPMSFVQFFQHLLRSPATRNLGLELLAVYGLRPLPVPAVPQRRSA